MVGWHRWLSGHEFEQAPVEGEGQGAWHAAVHGVRQDLAAEQTWQPCLQDYGAAL